MILFDDAYRGRRVLVTGHTGFKGSWLSMWLARLGAHVSGIALDPDTSPSHWDLLGLGIDSRRLDLRNAAALREAVREVRPEVVFHLAAQSLVRRSYCDPLGTWNTNVMGTANLLEACRDVGGLRAVVIATSDKCYQNNEWCWGYRETDPLGGNDPYSASKAATELLAASYRRSFFAGGEAALIATARAGNVIGGGDWSEDRLVPDIVRAIAAGAEVQIRSPRATRPWQHVLEPLSGYLLLGARLLRGDDMFATAWNFGPGPEANLEVATFLEAFAALWPDLRWRAEDMQGPHEAGQLNLDSARARTELGWRPVWEIGEAIERTVAWYRHHATHGLACSENQVDAFEQDAARGDAVWCR